MSDGSPGPAEANQLRVLVVETESSRREWLTHNLSQRGFHVYQAQGEDGQTLGGDAQMKVNEHFCQVAVITPRLFNLADPDDFSGLGLGQRLAPAGVVIFLERADDEVAYRAGRLGMGYVRRDHADAARRLIEHVEFQRRQRRMRIEWPVQNFERHVTSTLKMDGARVSLDHLQDLLGRTFPNASRLVLKLLPGLDTAAFAATPVRRAVVLWAQEQQQETNTLLTPKVVKIGSKAHINREVQNYTNFVQGRLQQDRQARLESSALGWQLGAIAYAFLGASPTDLVSFRQFYRQNPPGPILDVLRRLFTQTCQTWFQEEREIVADSRLYDLYNTIMELDIHLARLDQQNYRLVFDGLAEPLPNPALWAVREGKTIVFDQVTLCTTHGDLHADNFFVDQVDMTWLIDFEHTGRSHALRDFVELEADIKLRLTMYPPDEMAGALAALERALLTGRTLESLLLPSREVRQHPHVLKTFQVIAGLRHLAHLATGVTSLQEYTQALLYETLFMASLRQLRDTVQQRALLSAALLAERVTRRTGGLLSRQPLFPRMETGLLQAPDSPARRRMLQAHEAHLKDCIQAANLQQGQYQGRDRPQELTAGLAELRQEYERLQAVLRQC